MVVTYHHIYSVQFFNSVLYNYYKKNYNNAFLYYIIIR